MHNEYQGTEHGNFQTAINTFTQGLRELPTDYVTRVKNFLAEYLGTSRHPVPFGGRIRDFEHLDAWLSDTQAPPYLLLAAPAGRGKSALLVRWCHHLLTQHNLAIAYFPISIRFRTNLAGVAFPSLVALLASLHGEKVPADPNLHEDVWRGLFTDYITRPLPDGRSLLLVLDGVDEAADWTAGPGLFPLNPPPGLHIVLSARYLANDQDAAAWLKRLEWTRDGLARSLELYPLDRTGISSVLIQMGFPLDYLGTRVNIVSELYRLSEGDPLLVRLYVDDLWERGEAAVRFQPEDLRTIRPGLVGYFERWWRDQRLLWSEEAPQREAAAQIVLNLLAGALGPLSKDDIFSLMHTETNLQADEIEQHLASLARFVTGDGVHRGYVFSHPRLANYFLEERLTNEERLEVERRFLVWGEKTLHDLNEDRLVPEQASPYIVQYYGAHLERAQADAPIMLTLVSNGWRRAWQKLDRANAGFLSDVERAWRVAERQDNAAISSGKQAFYLGNEIRCLLSQVSINSVTSNISPRLMLEAVKTGIWTPAQGLACIRLISDLAPRSRELVGLAPYVQEPLRTDILQEALDTISAIKDEYTRLDTLVELAMGFSAELLWQVLEIVHTIEDEADRAGFLAELTPALSPYKDLIEQSLDLVQEIEDEEYRALALEGLASSFSIDQHNRVLHLAENIDEERYRTPVLTALIPYLTESLLQDLLPQVRAMHDGLSRIRLLTQLVVFLPTLLQEEVILEVLELERDIEDRAYRVEVLVKLAPFLPEVRLQQVLQEIGLLWDESYRFRALSDLLQSIPDELLSKFWHTALALKSEEYRTKLLMQLLPRLSEELLEKTLDLISTIWDEGYRVELLALFTLYASKDLLPRLPEIAETVKDQGYRVWLMAEIEASLSGRLPGTYSDMLMVFKAIDSREGRLQTLLAISPRLSDNALTRIFDFALPEIFSFTWATQSEEHRAQILIKLGSRLPEDWLVTVITMVRAMTHEVYQVQSLVALAPRIGKNQLSEALEIVRAMQDRERRAQVLEALVSSLPEVRKGERVQEMLTVLQVIKDETERAQLVVAYAPYMPQTLSLIHAQRMLEALHVMHDEEDIAHIITQVAANIPDESLENFLKIVQEMQTAGKQTQILEALIPRLPERLFPLLLQIVQNIHNERWRTHMLALVVAHAPKDILTEMLEMVQNLKGQYEHVEVLRALATYGPESSFSQLWEAVQALPNEGRRVLVLGALALRMPESFFPQLWEAVRAISSEEWQLWVLRTLAPHLSESLFEQVWEAVLIIKNKGQRVRMQEILVASVPEKNFAQIWKYIRGVSDEKIRISFLEVLAPRVPEAFFSEFFTMLQAISRQGTNIQVLNAMVPHVPAEFFLEFLKIVRKIPYDEIRINVLIPLLPYVPEKFFPQVWQVAKEIPNQFLQIKLITELAPHVPKRLLPNFWKEVLIMVDVERNTQILRVLLPYLVVERFIDVLEIVYYLPYEKELVEILEIVVPHLSKEQCASILGVIQPSQSEEQFVEVLPQLTWEQAWQVRALTVLASHLPDEKSLVLVPILLKVVQTLKVEEDQSWMLTHLAYHIPEGLQAEMLEAIWSLSLERYRVQVLNILLPTLSLPELAEILGLVIAKMRTTGDAKFGLELLKVTGPFAQISSSTLLYPILHEILRLLSQQERRDTLLGLKFLAPTIRMLSTEDAVIESSIAALEVGYWWP